MTALTQSLKGIVRWFDTDAGPVDAREDDAGDTRFDLVRCIPFLLMHVACLAVIWVGWSGPAVIAAAVLYLVRMFAITAFYHRYFSHRCFRCGRLVQLVFAVLGCAAVQRGPLWWAAHHREHHRHSDTQKDTHSPKRNGFLWSHMLWFTCKANFATRYHRVKDLAKFPELVFLNRYDMLVPILLAAGTFALGVVLNALFPHWGTSGPQMLVWGFFISTVVLAHMTFTINSLAHVVGKRAFDTSDDSRNNWFLALITLGEGWHNNHHHFPNTARAGFMWWEFDPTYLGLKVMSWFGLVWDLKQVPQKVLAKRLSHAPQQGGAT